MFKLITAGIATLTALGLSGHAWASDDTSDNSGTITVSVTVESLVTVTIDDNSAGLTSNSLEQSNNTTDMTASAQRAAFTVRANNNYDISVTPGATWTPSSIVDSSTDKLVKFTGATTSSNYLGGELFLDNDLDSDSGSDLVNWSRTNGSVSVSSQSAGTKQWGLGAIFLPEYAGDSSSSTGVSGLIAPADTYSTTATVTVSLSS
jgi:hypothetical protein